LAGLEDRRADFERHGARVLAVNPATLAEHRQWALLLGLHFPILSDADWRVTRAFGCKTPFLLVVRRTVYALGRDGRVVFAARGHAAWDEVEAAIRAAE